MKLERKYWLLMAVNGLAALGFTAWYIAIANFEFMIYIGVVIFFMGLIFFTRNKVDYAMPVLWGLTIWALLHMSGGTFMIGEVRLYDFIFIPIVGEPYNVLRFDQLIHAFGFGATTLVAYHLMKPHLLDGTARGKGSLLLVLALAGMGAGSVNEIVEFLITVVNETSGVGGYINNSVDLIANATGATIAATYVYLRGE